MMRLSAVAVVCVVLVVTTVSACYDDNGKECACGPGCQNCQWPPFGRTTPQYHVKSVACGENDPNGPFYDETHKMYHLFYQDHVAITPGHGPDWGHAVSKDLIHWSHLVEGIWNGPGWYDDLAIFTGSTTMVDGKPVVVYPGICDRNGNKLCTTGTTLNIATPKDPSDPLYVEWEKASYNPIVPDTQRDPSTAWQTDLKEWRLTTFTGDIYRSMDFKSWTNAGALFPGGECPSFFPLPDLVPGFSADGPLPTHIHKRSTGGKDVMRPGTYVAGAVNTTGTWNVTDDTPGHIIDVGDYYASKDFYDPVQKRRLNWGWAKVPPASTQTLPRQAFYHPVHKRLMWSPIKEQDALRAQTLVDKSSVSVKAGSPVFLGVPNQRGNQSEFIVEFPIPSSSAQFGVGVMGDSSSGSNFFSIGVDFTPNTAGADTYSAVVGSGTTQALSKYMPGIDLPGSDYNVTNVKYTDPHTCQQFCFSQADCVAYTYVVRPPLVGSCCLKNAVPNPNPKSTCTSGVKNPPTPGSHSFNFKDTLPILKTDKTIQIRVFTDNTFTETFFSTDSSNGIGVALTSSVQAVDNAQDLVIWSTVDMDVANVKAYYVSPIWVPAEEQLP